MSYAGEDGAGAQLCGDLGQNLISGAVSFPTVCDTFSGAHFPPRNFTGGGGGSGGRGSWPGAEQKAGRKGKEVGQGMPTTQYCSPCSFPAHPHPLRQTRSLG